MEQRRSFRTLVEAPEILVLPGAYDAMSARLIEQAGFSAGYLTGYGHSASKLGRPDVGLMTLSEMAERVRDTVDAVHIPFVADGDTGFGNNVNVVRTVRSYERAGACAIQLEDQKMPKKCGHMTGRQLIPAEEMAEKIQAAAAARQDRDFLLIARTDARTGLGLEEAIRRAKLYERAGADLIFVESLESVEEMRLVNRAVELPTVANMVEGGRSPSLTAAQLQELGYSVVFFPVAALYAAAKGVWDLLQSLRKTGSTAAFSETDRMLRFEQFNRFIGLEAIRQIEANDFSCLRQEGSAQEETPGSPVFS